MNRSNIFCVGKAGTAYPSGITEFSPGFCGFGVKFTV